MSRIRGLVSRLMWFVAMVLAWLEWRDRKSPAKSESERDSGGSSQYAASSRDQTAGATATSSSGESAAAEQKTSAAATSSRESSRDQASGTAGTGNEAVEHGSVRVEDETAGAADPGQSSRAETAAVSSGPAERAAQSESGAQSRDVTDPVSDDGSVSDAAEDLAPGGDDHWSTRSVEDAESAAAESDGSASGTTGADRAASSSDGGSASPSATERSGQNLAAGGATWSDGDAIASDVTSSESASAPSSPASSWTGTGEDESLSVTSSEGSAQSRSSAEVDASYLTAPTDTAASDRFSPGDSASTQGLRSSTVGEASERAADTMTGGRSGSSSLQSSASSHAPAGAIEGDGTEVCPPEYPIKGNASSRIYHQPGQPSYDRTVPEFCFAAEEDAIAAGFRAPRR